MKRKIRQTHIDALAWTIFCKRTEDPKLTWLERELDKLGIEHKRNGHSWHAPVLEVRKGDLGRAMDLLGTPSPEHLRQHWPTIDDIPDAHPYFSGTVNPSGQAGIGWHLCL